MKTLWNMLSFLAMVNLLALLMFVGWLWQTGRLDRDRLQDVRTMLTPTIQEAREAETERQRLEDEARTAAFEAERRASPDLASAARVRQITRVDEQERLAMRRLADERRQVLGEIDARLGSLAQERSDMHRESTRRSAAGDAEQQAMAARQLEKAVGTLQALPPRQARDMLIELIERGSADRAVAYLDRMQARSRAKVLREFKERPELATELLERLRTLGAAPGDEEPDDSADAASSTT